MKLSAETEARFWAKVQKSDGCWEWTGGRAMGYGMFAVPDPSRKSKQRHAYAHRLSYELLVGPIPLGLQIDHLCRNRICVNPTHLEPVTASQNIQRGYDARRRLGLIRPRRKTASKAPQRIDETWVDGECPAGHPRAGNMVVDKRGWRTCIECRRARARRYRAANRDSEIARVREWRRRQKEAA
jgi:hypothetical protein